MTGGTAGCLAQWPPVTLCADLLFLRLFFVLFSFLAIGIYKKKKNLVGLGAERESESKYQKTCYFKSK